MKHDFIPIWSCLLIGSLLFITSCSSHHKWEQESNDLLEQSFVLELRHRILDERVDSLWDTASAQLDKAMPSDFPPIDRDIFLKARNADHMRMFMSYNLLDEKAKAIVTSAGVNDAMLAEKMRDLYVQRQVFEKKKNEFLCRVEHQDKQASREFAGKFLLAANESN